MRLLSSTFPSGSPGLGLLLLRLSSGVALVVPALRLHDAASPQAVVSDVIAAAGGLLLLGGLWTPVAGVLVAATEVWLAFSHVNDPWVSLLLVGLGAALALLGPGAWSVDARLYGWKRIDIRRPGR